MRHGVIFAYEVVQGVGEGGIAAAFHDVIGGAIGHVPEVSRTQQVGILDPVRRLHLAEDLGLGGIEHGHVVEHRVGLEQLLPAVENRTVGARPVVVLPFEPQARQDPVGRSAAVSFPL
jgi:hypothetical protein